jgi:hypothetical protein
LRCQHQGNSTAPGRGNHVNRFKPKLLQPAEQAIRLRFHAAVQLTGRHGFAKTRKIDGKSQVSLGKCRHIKPPTKMTAK